MSDLSYLSLVSGWFTTVSRTLAGYPATTGALAYPVGLIVSLFCWSNLFTLATAAS